MFLEEAIMKSSSPAVRISEKMAQSVINRYKPEQVQWHYEHGLVLMSVYALGTRYQLDGILFWVEHMYDTKILDDGSIATYKKDEFNLDQINPGKTLFDLYEASGNEKYRKAIETLRSQLNAQPRTASGGFWHKKIYPEQMWLDGLYMQGPFYARYASSFGTDADMADVVSQLILVESKTRDPKTGLLYHAWDESRKQLWANRDTGCSPHFWGRAMGWYCMALVDVLDYIPADSNITFKRDALVSIVRSLASAIERYQDAKSSLWFQILDQGMREKNYLETSASSMFVYFLLKAVRMGYLTGEDAVQARACAMKGYTALVSKMLREDAEGQLHLQGICSVAGLGGNPYRDGSFDYYVKEAIVEDDFKGVGPFILASIEVERV